MGAVRVRDGDYSRGGLGITKGLRTAAGAPPAPPSSLPKAGGTGRSLRFPRTCFPDPLASFHGWRCVRHRFTRLPRSPGAPFPSPFQPSRTHTFYLFVYNTLPSPRTPFICRGLTISGTIRGQDLLGGGAGREIPPWSWHGWTRMVVVVPKDAQPCCLSRLRAAPCPPPPPKGPQPRGTSVASRRGGHTSLGAAPMSPPGAAAGDNVWDGDNEHGHPRAAVAASRHPWRLFKGLGKAFFFGDCGALRAARGGGGISPGKAQLGRCLGREKPKAEQRKSSRRCQGGCRRAGCALSSAGSARHPTPACWGVNTPAGRVSTAIRVSHPA